jgi:hypothetical protein
MENYEMYKHANILQMKKLKNYQLGKASCVIEVLNNPVFDDLFEILERINWDYDLMSTINIIVDQIVKDANTINRKTMTDFHKPSTRSKKEQVSNKTIFALLEKKREGKLNLMMEYYHIYGLTDDDFAKFGKFDSLGNFTIVGEITKRYADEYNRRIDVQNL